MRSISRELRRQKKSIGLVPTRGGLHEGHLSLASRARELCDAVFVSVVRSATSDDVSSGAAPDLARDAELAFARGVDFIFAPGGESVFDRRSTSIAVEGFSGRFAGSELDVRGFTTTLNKLLNITEPDLAFLGRRRAHEVILARRMVRDLAMGVEIVVCPTVREEDGLAVSSASARLNTQERKAATVLFRALERCKTLYSTGEQQSPRLITAMQSLIESQPLARVDYVAITDTEKLEDLEEVLEDKPALVSVSADIGVIRLTDNLVLNGEL